MKKVLSALHEVSCSLKHQYKRHWVYYSSPHTHEQWNDASDLVSSHSLKLRASYSFFEGTCTWYDFIAFSDQVDKIQKRNTLEFSYVFRLSKHENNRVNLLWARWKLYSEGSNHTFTRFVKYWWEDLPTASHTEHLLPSSSSSKKKRYCQSWWGKMKETG